MSKLKLLIGTFLVSCLMTSASVAAVSEGVRIGIGIADTSVDASGSETLRSGSGANTTFQGTRTAATASADTQVPHIFIEKTFANGMTLGIDYIPGEADVSATKTGDDDDIETAGANTAKAAVSEHITYYALMPLGDTPLFVKGGITNLTVETQEVLATGSAYGNKDVNGVTAGIGAHVERDNGFFARIEANVSEYEDMTITSDGSNIIQADINTSELRLSIGKSF